MRNFILGLLQLFVLCAVYSVGAGLGAADLQDTFRLVSGPNECPLTFQASSVRANNVYDTLEFNVTDMRLGGNVCRGEGYINLARQGLSGNNLVMSTTVRRRGGGGGGGGRGGSGGGRGSSSSRPSSGSSSSRPSSGSSGFGRVPKPAVGKPGGAIKRPSTIGGSRGKVPKGTRLSGAGINGKKLLGAAIVAGAFAKGYKGGKGRKWKKRRSYLSGDGGEEDEFEELSDALDGFNLEHYFGFQTITRLSVLANPDFTKWLFQCGKYGGEFRTKFLFFELARARSTGDLATFEANVRYMVVSGLTNDGEFSAYKENPCIFVAGNTSVTAGNSNNQQPVDCLPADAMVTLGDATSSTTTLSTKRVDQLVEGDSAHIGGEIFMFTHRDPYRVSSFIRFETASNGHLEVTPGHYVYANSRFVAAREVRIGDTLTQQDGAKVSVTNIQSVLKRGTFNPQTTQGDVVVNGFLVSTYTEAVHPNAAHGLLAPLRMIYQAFNIYTRALYGGLAGLTSN